MSLWYNIICQVTGCGAVGSALPWGGRGRKFKSCHSDHSVRSDNFSRFIVFIQGEYTGKVLPDKKFSALLIMEVDI